MVRELSLKSASCQIKWLPEARTEQEPIHVAELPTSHVIVSSTPLEAKHKTPLGQGVTAASPDDVDRHVRIERSIVVDGGLQDEDPKKKDFYGSSRTAREQESNV